MNSFKFYLKGSKNNPLVINDVIDITTENGFIRVRMFSGEIYKISLDEIIFYVRET